MIDQPNRKSKAARYLLEGAAVLSVVLLLLIVGALHLTRPPIPYAQKAASLERTVPARVVRVLEASHTTDQDGLVIVTQKLELDLSLEAGTTRSVTVDYNGMAPTLRAARFREGDRALVMISERPDGTEAYAVADHVRWGPLLALTGTFVAVTIVAGRWQGLRALGGLVLSGLLIGGFVLPQILAHRDPILISLTGTALLLALTLYLIQGWNRVAHAGVLGMLASLAFTGGLAIAWVHLSRLTGFGSEETMYLQAIGVGVGMRGLLLAGMILGVAGVLDDVILAQSVTAFELYATDPAQGWREVYRRAMKVGRAHLLSMVNTLVLAYASTALPLIILFYLYPEPWFLTVNRELVAEEIVRALVGSLGLTAAVPITTAIAAWTAVRTHVSPPR
jgi:uncharacterized membrane protein